MATSKKNKALSIADIKKQNTKEYGKLKRVNLKNGMFVDIREIFRPSDIQRLIADYQECIHQLRKEDISLSDVGDVIPIYYMLIIKHFTDQGAEIPVDARSLVGLARDFLDAGILDEILTSFPEQEFKKLEDMVKKVEESSKILGNQMGELMVEAAVKDESVDFNE